MGSAGGDVVLDPEPAVAGENKPFRHRVELEVHGRPGIGPRRRRADLHGVVVGPACGGGRRRGRPGDADGGGGEHGDGPGHRRPTRGRLSAIQSFTVTVSTTASGSFTDDPLQAWGDTGQGGSLHGAPNADRRPAERSGSAAVLLDRSSPAGGRDAGPARAPAGAAGGAGRGVQSVGAGGAALDQHVAGGGDDPDPGTARDGAFARRCWRWSERSSISGPTAAVPEAVP